MFLVILAGVSAQEDLCACHPLPSDPDFPYEVNSPPKYSWETDTAWKEQGFGCCWLGSTCTPTCMGPACQPHCSPSGLPEPSPPPPPPPPPPSPPPLPTTATLVIFTVVLAGSVDNFDDATQTSFITNLAAVAAVEPSQVVLSIAAGSVEVTARIVAAHDAQAQHAVDKLSLISTPDDATRELKVEVEHAEKPRIASASPPSLPLPPPAAPQTASPPPLNVPGVLDNVALKGGSDDTSIVVAVSAAAAAMSVIVVAAVLVMLACKAAGRRASGLPKPAKKGVVSVFKADQPVALPDFF